MAQFDTTAERTRERTDSIMRDAKATGREARAAFTDVADTFGDALSESVQTRPYATLALAAGIGFLFGAVWSR